MKSVQKKSFTRIWTNKKQKSFAPCRVNEAFFENERNAQKTIFLCFLKFRKVYCYEVRPYWSWIAAKILSRRLRALSRSLVFNENRMRSAVESGLWTVTWHHHTPRLFHRWWLGLSSLMRRAILVWAFILLIKKYERLILRCPNEWSFRASSTLRAGQ